MAQTRRLWEQDGEKAVGGREEGHIRPRPGREKLKTKYATRGEVAVLCDHGQEYAGVDDGWKDVLRRD